MQMGVLVAPVLEPVSAQERASLKKLDQYAPPTVNVDGSGGTFVVSRSSNASFKAMNAVLDGGGKVSIATSDTETTDGSQSGAMIVSGFDRES